MLYIVSHTGPTGDKLTAHKTLQHARQSAEKRQQISTKSMDGAVIYEVSPSDLREVETHGRVETQQVPGQQPLF